MYFEYYFLVNAVLNYVMIDTTSSLTRKYNKLNRKILGSLVGTIYSILYLFSKFSFLFYIPIKIICMSFIVYISFIHKSVKDYIQTSLVFYAVNIFLAGNAYFIIYFTGMSYIKVSFIVVCAYISIFLVKLIFSDVKKLNYIKEITKDIKIVINSEEINCKAIMDSGNLLVDPISKGEVIMVDLEKVESILNIKENIIKKVDILERPEEIMDKLDSKLLKRIRLIPYRHAIDCNSKLILGLRSDYIEIDGDKIAGAIIGVADLKNDDYNAIINPNMLAKSYN
ncbi:MAG: sigma-E processing peptidase SpoIIGA [Clostridioides sp.]|nr:sigma-E processing peptidase SpoIIGA [Clostridioides sp.]